MEELPDGIKHALLINGSGGLKAFDPKQLEGWTPASGNLWLHLDLTNPATKEWLYKESSIPNIVSEALLSVESRPRLTKIGDGALLAFRGVNLNEGAAPDDMIGIRIWVEENRIITTFRRNLRSTEDIAQSLREGEGPTTAPDVMVALAERIVARMTDTVDNMEELIAELESSVLVSTDRNTRFALANLRRQIIALKRYLTPQREALSSLVTAKLDWISEAQRISLRETLDRLSRHLEDLDAIRERAAVTQEELQNRLAEQQNVRMYVLSIVAAIFLPLGFLTGLLGINVGGIPGSDDPKAFMIFLLILAVVVSLQFLFFRLRKWL